MTISLTNPNTTTTVSGVNFSTSPYPTNLVNAANANPAMSCTSGSSATLTGGAAGNNPIGATGGTIAANGVCTITVNLSGGSTGNYTVPTGPISSNNAGSGSAVSATLNVSNFTTPTAAVSFSPAQLPGSQTTVMTITLSNSNSSALTGASPTFTMNYPSGLINGTSPAAATTCSGGAVTAAASGGSLVLSGGTIPANGSCTVTVTLAATAADTYYVNTGFIFTTNAGAGSGSSGKMVFVSPPLITKTFVTNPVAPTPATTVLKIVVSNPGQNMLTLNGVNFTDGPYPGGMINSGSASVSCSTGSSGTATTPTTTSLSFSSGILVQNGSCTIQVTLVAPATAGSYTNTTSVVGSTEGGNGLTASAILSVAQPGVAKAFSPTSILYGNTSTLTITLSNSNGSPVTGAAFTDTYPSGITHAPAANPSTTCSGGTVTATSNGGFVSLSGGTIPAASGGTPGTCTVTVTITGTSSVTNTIPAGGVTVTGGGSNQNPASATIGVSPPPTVTNTFSPALIPLGNTSSMTITISNPTSTLMDNISFTDTYPIVGPSQLTNSSAATLSCTSGSSAALSGGGVNGTSIGITAGSLTGNGSCTITAVVKATTAGTYNNSTGNVAWRSTPPGGTLATATGPGASATLNVLQPFTFGTSFTPSTIAKNDTSLLTITLNNSNAVAVTGVAFTDVYDTHIVNAAIPGVYSGCGGTATAASGVNSLALSGGSIPANGSCTITVYVTSATAGTWNNTLSSITSANDGTSSTAATASLTATSLAKPSVAQAFSPSSRLPGYPTTLTITMTNPNGYPILSATFTDSYPAQIVNDSLPGAATSCPNGTVTAAPGGGSLVLSGATIPANSSCTVTVSVVSSIIGTWSNPANPLIVTSSNANDSNPAATATLTIYVLPNITMLKSVQVFSDPVNGTSSPKAIPGAQLLYTTTATNFGAGATDAESVVITEPLLSAAVSLVVAGSPVTCTNGTPTSGLTFNCGAYNDATDQVYFSRDGTDWSYTPVVGANNTDPLVRYLKVTPSGPFNGANGGNNPNFTITFKVIIK